MDLKFTPGGPSPFGVSITDNIVNFAIYSREATDVVLSLFDSVNLTLLSEINLDPIQNRTGYVWHIAISNMPENVCYAYRFNKSKGKIYTNYINPKRLILDPFAKTVKTSIKWGESAENYQPYGIVNQIDEFDWEGDRPLEKPLQDLVIYEMHVRGFTKDSSSKVSCPGTFLGIIEKIPYLKDLGVNAIKLLPIQEFNECEYKKVNPLNGEQLFNFWGYSTVNFFAPMNRYADRNPFIEFKIMVKELHRNGIEVFIDIVFNHTAEGPMEGPIYSYKGIDPPVYYLHDHQHDFLDFTGCGNTVNCNHPIVRTLIRSCLQYWVTEMHVDGFRFDLAAVFMRGIHGEPLQNAPLIDDLSRDPVLANTKLIAEPWDICGLYKLGSFFAHEERWSEWNDKYRDSVRRFLKGDRGEKREFATRICGSEDIFGVSRTPCSSINFVTAHDGFTLHDLVSYNHKNNFGNGENNNDGNSYNLSWNCGFEGETENPDVCMIRERQMRNFHMALMLSQGVPMLTMGNEYAHTRFGNNNTWCQDNALNWFLWDEIDTHSGFFRFYRGLIHFRKKHSILHLGRYLTPEDIDWHGEQPNNPDWEGESQFIAFTLKDRKEGYQIYAAFNARHREVSITLPPGPWRIIAHTGNPSPQDFYEEEHAPMVEGATLTLPAHSAIILKA